MRSTRTAWHQASMAATHVHSGWHKIRPEQQHNPPLVCKVTHAVLPLQVPSTLGCSEGRPTSWLWGAFVRLRWDTTPGCNLLGVQRRIRRPCMLLLQLSLLRHATADSNCRPAKCECQPPAAWPRPAAGRPQAAWPPSMPLGLCRPLSQPQGLWPAGPAWPLASKHAAKAAAAPALTRSQS